VGIGFVKHDTARLRPELGRNLYRCRLDDKVALLAGRFKYAWAGFPKPKHEVAFARYERHFASLPNAV
jgi:hypothetical protein